MAKNALSLKDIVRSTGVTRWHCVPTRSVQSLAEHQYMVAIMAQHIAKAVVGEKLSESDELLLLNYALFHDTPEIAMGDIPTPMKREMANRDSDYGDILATIEKEVCPQYHYYHEKAKASYIICLVKLADIMDAISYLDQNGYTKYTDRIQQKLTTDFHQRLASYAEQYPEFQWSRATEVLDEILHGDDHLFED